MSDTTPSVPEPQSDLQASLIESGAHAQTVDADAMLAQMRAMQINYERQNAALLERIKSLETERGVPSDPIAGGVANLLMHVKARAAQYPNDDFSDIIAEIEALPESDSLTVNHTANVHDLVSEAVESRPRHELGYVRQLSRELHRLVLKKSVTV